MRSSRKLFRKMAGGGDLYMTGVDKNAISKFIPGQLQGLALWIRASKESCAIGSVESYVKTISPSIGANILSQYPNPSESVVVAIESLITDSPNSLIRLEVDTTGRAKFPILISDPEKLDVISLQDMIDTTNPADRKEKLCTKSELPISSTSMTVYTIGTNIAVTFNDNLKTLLVSVVDLKAPVTEFSEIIVFNRVLAPKEVEQMEGYLSFRRNDQYLLKPGHPFLPNLESFTFADNIKSQLTEIEVSLEADMEAFNKAVNTYEASLPGAKILLKAPQLKQKAQDALKQIAAIRETVV